MFTDKIKQLADVRAKLAALESEVGSALPAELAALPKRYGFDDVASFVVAVQAACGRRVGRPPGAAKTKKKRTRTKITDAIRAEVKKLAQAGTTGAAIAKAVGISLPSVHNIKKAFGLTAKR